MRVGGSEVLMLHSVDLLEGKRRALSEVLRRSGVSFSWLFGSAGRYQPFRDLDVGVVYPDGPPGLMEILELGRKLEQAAGVPVDCVVLQSAPIALQFEASKGILLSAQDLEAVADWKERVWTEYFDRQFFLRGYAREMLESRAQGAF